MTMFERHVFPVKEIRRGRDSYFFVQGKQVEVDAQPKRLEKTSAYLPTTNWDYLKHALVSWIPSLNFGWFTPSYRPVSFTFEYIESVTCLNVIPIHSTDRDFVELIDYECGYDLSEEVSEADWLLGCPPTPSQVKKARERVRQLRCSERFALYMAWPNKVG